MRERSCKRPGLFLCSIHVWAVESEAARRVLRERNPAGLVDALLDDGDDELPWQTATSLPALDLGERVWLRFAEARQKSEPAQALPVYWRLIDSILETANRRAYSGAVRLLKRARDAAAASQVAGCGVARCDRRSRVALLRRR